MRLVKLSPGMMYAVRPFREPKTGAAPDDSPPPPPLAPPAFPQQPLKRAAARGGGRALLNRIAENSRRQTGRAPSIPPARRSCRKSLKPMLEK